MQRKKNLYLVLDLTTRCTQNEILHAYNRAKSTYSRDSLAAYSLYDDNAKDSILREIEDAYHILGDARKRRQYDVSMGYAEGSVDDNYNYEDSIPHSHTSPSSTPIKNFKKKLEVTPNIRVEANPAFETEIQEASNLSGAFLRSIRLYRGYTEDQFAGLCHLKADHIIAIEEEKPLNLHHPVYLRGHLMLICEALQIPNANMLAKTYIERLQQEDKLARNKSL
ncbi:MAG: helix-turn-helix domain-containing protein [Bdellovibrionota bacterium]